MGKDEALFCIFFLVVVMCSVSGKKARFLWEKALVTHIPFVRSSFSPGLNQQTLGASKRREEWKRERRVLGGRCGSRKAKA